MSVQPKYQQIREELTREIAAGVFASGEKLPTEEHLARQFGVARQTVLKALDAMKLEGVITSERGRGTFVAVTHGRKRSAQENCRQLVFISSNLEDSFGHRVLLGVERAARQIGCSLVTCNTRNDSEREAEYLRRARNTGADGIILLPYLRHPNGELVSRVAESVPLVCVDNVPPGVTVPLVTTDNFRAAHDAVLRLIDMGHRNIGFILSRMEYAAAPGSIGDRYRGYRRALEERGIEFRPEWVAELGPHLAEARPQDIGLELYGYPAMHLADELRSTADRSAAAVGRTGPGGAGGDPQRTAACPGGFLVARLQRRRSVQSHQSDAFERPPAGGGAGRDGGAAAGRHAPGHRAAAGDPSEKPSDPA